MPRGMVAGVLTIVLSMACSIDAYAEAEPGAGADQSQEQSDWNPLTWKWVPTEEEIHKYRRSWNPMTHGPILNTGIDIQPKGQFLVQPFVFGEIGHERFTNHFGRTVTDSPFHLRAVAPTLIFAYGITDHFELNVAPSWLWFNSSQTRDADGRTIQEENDVGDTTIYLKYRPIVQDPETARPSVTIYNGVTLPSSQWFGTKGIPGGSRRWDAFREPNSVGSRSPKAFWSVKT